MPVLGHHASQTKLRSWSILWPCHYTPQPQQCLCCKLNVCCQNDYSKRTLTSQWHWSVSETIWEDAHWSSTPFHFKILSVVWENIIPIDFALHIRNLFRRNTSIFLQQASSSALLFTLKDDDVPQHQANHDRCCTGLKMMKSQADDVMEETRL